jgi:hypothetical protein
MQINQTLYIFLILLLIVILISPSVQSIKAKDIEIKLIAPPPSEFVLSVLSPAKMEQIIKEHLPK